MALPGPKTLQTFFTRRMGDDRSASEELHALGFCSTTTDGDRGDCGLGDKGWLGLTKSERASWPVAVQACTRKCMGCSRCRIISLSLKWKDCSWYQRCDLQNLKKWLPGFRTVVIRNTSAAVVPAAPLQAKSAPAAPLPRVKRDALRLGGKRSVAGWPWASPHAAVRVAALLFGKIGTTTDPSSFSHGPGDPSVIHAAQASFASHIVSPNPDATISVRFSTLK